MLRNTYLSVVPNDDHGREAAFEFARQRERADKLQGLIISTVVAWLFVAGALVGGLVAWWVS